MKFKILLVDDEQDLLDLLAEEFRDLGLEVLLARNGNEAIHVLKMTEVDLIVSDYRMPHGNGLELLDFVNQMKVIPKFFFFSAEHQLYKFDFIKEGKNKFFQKPSGLDSLIEEVGKELQNSKKQ